MTTPPVNPRAFALRPVRMDVVNNQFINYEGTTFPKGPSAGCAMYVRRLEAFGLIVDESDLILDVLDESGDIIQDFYLSRKGFEYLRHQLKFRRERAA